MEVHEIINRLNRMAVNTGTLNCFGCRYENNCGTHGCAVMREAAEKLEEHRWIPVTERIPQSDRYVLLSFKNFSLPLVGRCETDEEGSAFYIGDETVSCSKMGVFVNAWMELPERYVGGMG